MAGGKLPNMQHAVQPRPPARNGPTLGMTVLPYAYATFWKRVNPRHFAAPHSAMGDEAVV